MRSSERSSRAKKPRARKPARLAPGDRVGPWRIESELGHGGMGSVYAVTHTGFGKRAALKVCHPAVLGEKLSIEMFVREARVVHLIDHPGVPDIFATGTYDRRPYLAMERLHGKTLGRHIESLGGELSKTQALDIFFEVASVVSAAHARGVVHRDIKLDNVFILDTPPGAPIKVKLLDWGVAVILEELDPMDGMVAGTLTYVAPELIRGALDNCDEVTTAVDVYSLGVLLYQLLFGQPPFTHMLDHELIRMHLELPPTRPANLWPEIPSDLETTLLAMLAKEPRQRPSIDDVLRGIDFARLTLQTRLEPAPHAPARMRFADAVRGLVARFRASNDYEILEVIEIPNENDNVDVALAKALF